MKKKVLLIIVAIIILLMAFITFSLNGRLMAIAFYHNNIKSSTEFKVDGEELYMNGYICSKTPNQLKEIIEKNSQINTIVMLEVTGSLDDEANFPMARWVREQGLNTYITKNSDIESGGTDFFLSGVKRTMEDGAKVGVHSWREIGTNKEAKDVPKDSPEHELNRKYIVDVLGEDSFYWYTVYSAPADDMYYMTNDEISKYNLITEPIIY